MCGGVHAHAPNDVVEGLTRMCTTAVERTGKVTQTAAGTNLYGLPQATRAESRLLRSQSAIEDDFGSFGGTCMAYALSTRKYPSGVAG